MAEVLGVSRTTLLERGPLQDEEPLLAVEQRVLNIMSLSHGLDDDHELDSFGRELDRLDAEIRRSVPRTAAGIAVKIRHLWASAKDDEEAEDFENLRTIHEALRLLEKDCDVAFADPPPGASNSA